VVHLTGLFLGHSIVLGRVLRFNRNAVDPFHCRLLQMKLTIRTWCAIFTCIQKLTNSRLLPHGTKKQRSNEKKNKNRDAQKRSCHKVRGVSPEAGRESMVRKICERGRFWHLKREGKRKGVVVGELWVDRVRRCGRSRNRQVRGSETGMRLTKRTIGSWFKRLLTTTTESVRRQSVVDFRVLLNVWFPTSSSKRR